MLRIRLFRSGTVAGLHVAISPGTIASSARSVMPVRRIHCLGCARALLTLRQLKERSALPMKIKLHHVNVCSKDVPGLEEFYRDVLDLAPEPSLEQGRILGQQGYDGSVAFLSDGTTQFHLAEKDYGISFRTGLAINPVERGHIAFRTDDIEAFKKRLQEKGIPFSDYGAWAMKGWEQIFFHDPEGNVIEVHQVRDS